MSKRPAAPESILAEWLERDLTASVAELSPAFEVDEILRQVIDVVESRRHPLLVGESGVGKTAVVHELVRRLNSGQVGVPLAGRRVLQLSLGRRAAGLKEAQEMRPATQDLVEALLAKGRELVPFFADFDYAYSYDLEPQFAALAAQFPGPILAEGSRTGVAAMMENAPELGERFIILELDEPDLARAEKILLAWRDEQAARGRRFADEAVAEALHLSHRFLARGRLPRKALDLLGQVAGLSAGAPVGQHDVIERFCRMHRVPPLLVDPDVPLDLAAVEKAFHDSVLGQPEAVQAVVRMISLIKAGLSDVRRPFGVFLFVGPTGVGKTHLAQHLAEYLFGSRERMVRLNMADYQQEADALVLLGDPNAYTLPQRRGLLTRRLMGHPFAVVLFDEFEKAHPKVHDRFLQLVDEGAFINGAGETVSCRSCILIATSNTGAELYRGRSLGFASTGDLEAVDREVDRLLQQAFRFEFLNRFDQMVHFHPLTREDIRTIARWELDQLTRRAGVRRRGVRLEVDESVLDWLAMHGYDPYFGARVLRRTIERHVTVALAEAIVRENPQAGAVLELSVRRNRPHVAVRKAREAAPRREVVALPFGTTERVLTLDASSLQRAADELLASAAKSLDLLAAKKEERRRLLDALNASAGWDGSARSVEALERFRELDVAIRTEDRLAAPVQRLALIRGGEIPAGSLADLARSVETAADALREWSDRLSEDGAGGVWLVVSGLDPLRPQGRWVRELASMELAWCRRLHLSADVVAYEAAEEDVVRVVLDIEGPGTATYVGMERGVHRLTRPRGGSLRARIDVIPKSAGAVSGPRLLPVRRKKSPFGFTVQWKGRLEVADRGIAVDLVADRADVLGHLLIDLEAAMTVDNAPAELARVYGENGTGARDTRTGATVARFKDVLRGKLEPLAEAWRRQRLESREA